MTSCESTQRQIMTRRQEVDLSCVLTLPQLQRMAEHKQNWRLEMEGYYEGTTLVEVWESPETDQELQERLHRETQAQARKAQAQARKLAREMQQYAELKRKFES